MHKFNRFHPFIFAIYPILSLWGINVAYIPFSDILGSLIAILSLTPVFLLITWLGLKNIDKATLIVSGCLFLFYAYGYISTGVKSLIPLDDHLMVVFFLGPFWLVLFSIWIWVVVRKIKQLSEINSMFFWMGATLFVLSLVPIIRHFMNPSSVDVAINEEKIRFENEFEWQSLSEPPDIYYIILDGYGRNDILSDIYNYDNSEFTNDLEERGFYVASQSVSNYNQTVLSLSSSLNMEYINYLYSDYLGKRSENRTLLVNMIRSSNVREILGLSDYQFVNIKSGFAHTDIPDADIYLGDNGMVQTYSGEAKPVDTFMWLFMDSTMVQGVIDLIFILRDLEDQDPILIDLSYQLHRERVLNAFDYLDDFTSQNGNFFVFAHIVAPHPPFVFDEDGNEIINSRNYTLDDGNHYHNGRDDYREKYISGYLGQLKFINTNITETIDHILDQSENPPIIILQSDHGPGAYLDWTSIENSYVPERQSILNAYYFPEGRYDLLYSEITPVNTFRVIFNTYFGGEFDLLDDKSYFSYWNYPFDFHDVSHLLDP